MKKFSLLLFSLINLASYAQTQKVTFEVKANIENQLKNVTDEATRRRVTEHLSKPSYFTLIDNGIESLFFKNNENETEQPNAMQIGKVSGSLYKNQKTNSYLNESNIMGENFLIKDVIPKYDWKLSTETRKIGDYNCKKATAISNGQTITAWYTNELTSKNGPAEFGGLPGFIIELNTFNKVYLALKIENIASQYAFTKPSSGAVINQKEYNEILRQQIQSIKNMN